MYYVPCLIGGTSCPMSHVGRYLVTYVPCLIGGISCPMSHVGAALRFRLSRIFLSTLGYEFSVKLPFCQRSALTDLAVNIVLQIRHELIFLSTFGLNLPFCQLSATNSASTDLSVNFRR